MGFGRVTIDGSLGSGVEKWSCGFALQNDDESFTTDPSVLAAGADDILALFLPGTGWSGDVRTLLGSGSTIDRVRVYSYDTPGQPAVAMGQSVSTAIPGSGTITMPPQCSLVVSLLTGIPGRRFRGRMYWPILTGTMTASLKKGGTSVSSLASSFATGLNAMAGVFDEPDNEAGVVVVSEAGNSVTTVTTVRIGDVIDTQRRRRDNLVEAYGSASL